MSAPSHQTTGAAPAPGASSIAERLDGQHVLITGVTGFIGEALLHELLAHVPGVRVSVLVRPKGSTTGAKRTANVLGKPVFADVVEAAGGVEALMRSRVGVVEGDLSDVPELPTDLDAVVHCAGDVSFDPPVDAGFRTNVVGTRELLDRIEETGADVHYVHISTAYVAGRRRGSIPEGPVDHAVDIEQETAWGLGQRDAVEARSRSVAQLSRHRKRAEKEHSRAGLLTAARATEEARREWVKEQLVKIGTERARSLGWTDCYTFTKALGERVVEAYAATHRASIVRPSIVESALEKPHPGWIEGFKMAEPLILAYGRGELPEFPASADTTIDIVPVDHVVGAIIAVLAHPPQVGEPAYFHVSSGNRNPLTFTDLYDQVRTYFDEHPFTAGERGSVRLPEWRFPGANVVKTLLVTSEKAHSAADYLLGHVPRSDRTRDLARTLDQQGKRLAFLRRYLDLYEEYAQAELRFDDANTLALFESLSPDDRETFAFDTAVIDWDVYLREIHCPAVTKPIRQLDARRRRQQRPDPSRLKVLDRADQEAGAEADGVEAGGTEAGGTEPAQPRVAAFFDMDGTLLSSNVIEGYLWLRLRELSGRERAGEIGKVIARIPALVQAERRERSDFLRTAYRQYEGARAEALDEIVDRYIADHVLSRLSPAAVRRVREHRAAGHRTVLITGAVRPLTRPLMPLFDHIESAQLAVDEHGVCTGFLATSPLVGESRSAWMRSYAARNGIDLAASYGYADSHSDLPLLDAVGNPVAVRPDVSLYRHARRNRWNIVDWSSPGPAGRSLNPAGGVH